MVINSSKDNVVEFVSYTGKYPTLCMGTLTLKINGTNYSFGMNGRYPSFWESGGYLDEDWDPVKKPWVIDCEKLPEQFVEYVDLIDEVINDNIPFGCCGGCS